MVDLTLDRKLQRLSLDTAAQRYVLRSGLPEAAEGVAASNHGVPKPMRIRNGGDVGAVEPAQRGSIHPDWHTPAAAS